MPPLAYCQTLLIYRDYMVADVVKDSAPLIDRPLLCRGLYNTLVP